VAVCVLLGWGLCSSAVCRGGWRGLVLVRQPPPFSDEPFAVYGFGQALTRGLKSANFPSGFHFQIQAWRMYTGRKECL